MLFYQYSQRSPGYYKGESGYVSDDHVGYLWTWKFLNPERKSCGFKNIWIRVDGALVFSNRQLDPFSAKVLYYTISYIRLYPSIFLDVMVGTPQSHDGIIKWIFFFKIHWKLMPSSNLLEGLGERLG